jgi:predicted Na+-dependent transporter
LLLLVLAPLAVGMAVCARRPPTAARLAQLAAPLSTIGLLVVIAIVLARYARIVLDAFGAVGPAALTAVLLALLLAAASPTDQGHDLAGGRGAKPTDRRWRSPRCRSHRLPR